MANPYNVFRKNDLCKHGNKPSWTEVNFKVKIYISGFQLL